MAPMYLSANPVRQTVGRSAFGFNLVPHNRAVDQVVRRTNPEDHHHRRDQEKPEFHELLHALTPVIATAVGLDGLEPSTSVLSGLRSNQLSYRPVTTMKNTTGRHHPAANQFAQNAV